MNWTFEPERPRLSTLATFLALSLLLHALLLAWLRVAHFSIATPPDAPIIVKLAPPPPAAARSKPAPPPAAAVAPPPKPQAPPEPKPDAQAQKAPPPPAVPLRKQVVAPSDQENDKAPEKEARLSDRDNRVERETVKRGNPDAGEKPPAAKPATRPATDPAKVGPPKPPPARVAKAEIPKSAAPKPAPVERAKPVEKPAAPKPAPPPRAQARSRPIPPPPAATDASPPEPVARADAPPMLEPPAERLDAPPRIRPRPPAAPRPRPEPRMEEDEAPPARSRAEGRSRPSTRAGKRPLPGLDALLPPAGDVLANAGPAAAAAERRGGAGGADPRDDPRRDLVSAPPPKPGFFGGPRGSFDSLPGVAQGSLTMLNTKADRFAPFVRRVGTRVFQNLLIFQRQNLGINDILAAHEPVNVRCLLDRQGRLKDVRVEDRSGSLAVDQTLTDALREAAFDSNPPPAAANADGEFEFVFVAQIAAQVGDGPGGPQVRMIESRLRVGLL